MSKLYLDPPGEGVAWLDAARDGRLIVQRCTVCGDHQHYPRAVCTHCGSSEVEWVEATGRGTVHTFSVVHRNPMPGWSDETPYVVAIVDLEEGARITTNIVGCAPADVTIGMRVVATFVDDGTLVLPKFCPE